MNIKGNLIKGLALSAMLLLGMGFVGCREEKGIFDKTPEQRLLDTESEVVKLLTSSEHGWALQFIAGENERFGGFTWVMKFNDKGEVLASSELQMSPATMTPRFYKSLYSVGRDRSATLNFNTFNDAIHQFSRPDVGHAGGPGKGYESDFNFLIQGIKEDGRIIELLGEKYRAVARLVRLEKPMSQYLEEILAMRAHMPNEITQVPKKMHGFSIEIDGKAYKIYPHADYAYYIVSAEGEESYNVPFWYTDRGVLLSRPIGSVTEFLYDAQSDLVRANTGKQIEELPDEAFVTFKSFEGTYFMEFEYEDRKLQQTMNGSLTLGFKENPDKVWHYTLSGLRFKAEARFNRRTMTPEFFWQELDGIKFGPEDKITNAYWGPMSSEGAFWTTERAGMYFRPIKGSDPQAYMLQGNHFTPEANCLTGFVKFENGKYGLGQFDENLPAIITKIKLTRY